MTSRLLSLALLLCLALPASAAHFDAKKIKKWPELDRIWARAFDAWMTDEDLAFFQALPTTEERKKYLEDAGFWQKWERLERDHEEMFPHVMAGEAQVGMTQDEVYMCWDKPVRIRKDVKKTAYVDVLFYEFERDRKGKEFLLLETSQTAYKNETITRLVYIDNGLVVRISVKGEEEDESSEGLPAEKKASKKAAPPAETTPAPETTPASEATPAADPTPAP